jgi:hypothetical protein
LEAISNISEIFRGFDNVTVAMEHSEGLKSAYFSHKKKNEK